MDLNAGAGGGDAETDTVIVNGTAASDRLRVSSPVAGEALVSGLSTLVQVDGSETPLDRVLLNALGGDDTVASGVGVSGPAAIVFLGGLGNDSARYTGTDYDDAVSITPNGTSVRAASPGFSALDVVAVESFTVQGFRGDDTLSAANGIAALTHLTLDGGDGDDVLGGGDGDDTLLGGDDDDVVDGNRGTDDAGLGTGDDHFVWDPGDGNDSVRGQAGYDVMDFNGSNADEVIDVFPNGTRTRLTRNVAAITMDFDTLEDVAVNALGGADTITVFDLSHTGVDTADIDLGGADAKPDTVIVNGTTRRDSVDVTRYGSQVADGRPGRAHADHRQRGRDRHPAGQHARGQRRRLRRAGRERPDRDARRPRDR